MEDDIEILKLRVLLCFLPSSEVKGTVTGIARTLNKEKYVISRIVSALEKEGLIDRTDVRNPVLTEEGYRQAMRYSERLEVSLNHLLAEGVDLISAKQDALLWSRYCSEKTMNVVRSAENRHRVRCELRGQKRVSGLEVCKLLQDGSYQIPFVLYREQIKDGNNISMANDGFEHPCTLLVQNGVGTVLLRSVDVRATDAPGDMNIVRVKSVKYFHNGWFINAESSGGVFTIPVEAVNFLNFGNDSPQMLHGSVFLNLECVSHSFPETNVFFTMML